MRKNNIRYRDSDSEPREEYIRKINNSHSRYIAWACLMVVVFVVTTCGFFEYVMLREKEVIKLEKTLEGNYERRN